MATNPLATKSAKTEAIDREQQLNNNRLLFNLILVALTVFFSCLIYANFMVRSAQGQWPPPGVNRMEIATPALMTIGLILSSLTDILGVRAFMKGRRSDYGRLMWVTEALGIAYVIAMLNLFSRIPYTGVYSAMFLALWVVHVIHAVAALLFLGYVLRRSAQGKFSVEQGYWPVEASANLWHFVTGVWIVLFIVLYFI